MRTVNRQYDFRTNPLADAPIAAQADIESTPLSRRTTFKILAGILAIACAARLLMAALLSAPCNDAYFYFCIADLLLQHDYEQAFLHLNLNSYPAILAVLHTCGIDWVTAGKYWGVAVSTLTIVPLFFWVRRLWGDRIALAASLLYAVHPELIELGVEPIREPTFWLFFALSLYWTSRAMDELTWRHFCLAGCAVALAIFTRTEGLVLLLVPAIGGIVALCREQLWKRRLKVVAGLVLCLAMTPALVVAVNVTLLRDHSRWEWGRLEYVAYLAAVVWPAVPPETETLPATAAPPDAGENAVPQDNEPGPVEASVPYPAQPVDVANKPSPPSTPEYPAVAHAVPVENQPAAPQQQPNINVQVPPAATVPPSKPLGSRLATFTNELFDTFGPLNLLFLGTGVYVCRRRRLWPHLVPLFIPSIAIMAAVWLRLSAPTGGINGRYFLSMYFFVAPLLAVGFLSLWRQIAIREFKLPRTTWTGQKTATVSLIILATILLADAVTSRHSRRERDIEIAASLSSEFKDVEGIIVDHYTARLGYEIHHKLPRTLAFTPLTAETMQNGPGMILVSTKSDHATARPTLQQEIEQLGYVPLPNHRWTGKRDDITIYVRPQKLATKPVRNPQ